MTDKLQSFIAIVKELAKVVFYCGVAAMAFQTAVVIGDSSRMINGRFGILENLRDVSKSLALSSDRVAMLIGPLESRGATDQTVAHVVADVAELTEQGTERVREFKVIAPALQSTVVNLDSAIQRIRDTEVPGISKQVRLLVESAAPVIAHADSAVQKVSPMLTAATSLITDTQESVDDNYWDVKALIESATVTAASIGKNSDATAVAVRDLTVQSAGISTDIHVMTQKIVAPKRWPAKIWDALKLGAGMAGHFIP